MINDLLQGHSLAASMSFKFPQFTSTHFSQVLGSRVSARAISLLYSIISWNPSWRSSAQEALKHSYFRQQTSQPTSASSTNLNMALKPSSRYSKKSDQSEGARSTVSVSQVEPVYGRELLRNYKEDTNKDKEDDLKQLLESLKSSDVVPVKHKKVTKKSDSDQDIFKQHKVNLLDTDGPSILTGERRYSKSPPKLKSNIKLSPRHKQSFGSYIPSFGVKNESATGPLVARRLFTEQADHNHNNITNKLDKIVNKSDSFDNADIDLKPGKNSTFGTKETLSKLSSKADFSTRVLESLSDYHHLGKNLLEYPQPRLINKVQSLPELKSEALLVGAKKALHDRAGFGSYVPSQLESPKAKLSVRTDWKAKYLK